MVRITMALLATLIQGWLFMIAVGIAHAEWVPALPTIGYLWAVLIVALLKGSFDTLTTADTP